jgi:hypothetical protein
MYLLHDGLHEYSEKYRSETLLLNRMSSGMPIMASTIVTTSSVSCKKQRMQVSIHCQRKDKHF